MPQIAGTPEEAQVRAIVREELASFAGLVLRRTSDAEARLTRSSERNLVEEEVRSRLAQIFGEALRDFSGPTAPGA